MKDFVQPKTVEELAHRGGLGLLYPGAPMGLGTHWPFEETTHTIPLVKEHQKAAGLVVEFLKLATTLASDTMLSETGKAHKLAAVATVARNALVAAGPVIERAEGHLVVLRRAIAAQAGAKPTDLAAALRASMVVGYFQGLDATGRLAHLELARSRGDVETIAAVVQAPQCLGLLATDEAVERWSAELLRLTAPKEFTAVEDLEEAIRWTRRNVEIASRFFDDVLRPIDSLPTPRQPSDPRKAA